MTHVSRLNRWLGCLGAVGIIAVAASTQSAQAATWYLQASQGSPTTVNDMTKWFSAPVGGTTLAAGPNTFDGQDLDSNGFTIRTSDQLGSATIGNAATTLTLSSKINTRTSFNDAPPETWFVETITTTGPTAELAAGNGSAQVGATTFTNNAAVTTVSGDGSTGRTMRMSFGTLLGAGDFMLSGTGTIGQFNVTNGSGFTGNIIWNTGSNATLEFLTDVTLGGAVITPTGGTINLHQNITLAGLTLGTNVLTPGTYSYATLNSTYDAFFSDGGSGSITIPPVPEPASLALLGLGTLLACKRRVIV